MDKIIGIFLVVESVGFDCISTLKCVFVWNSVDSLGGFGKLYSSVNGSGCNSAKKKMYFLILNIGKRQYSTTLSQVKFRWSSFHQ